MTASRSASRGYSHTSCRCSPSRDGLHQLLISEDQFRLRRIDVGKPSSGQPGEMHNGFRLDPFESPRAGKGIPGLPRALQDVPGEFLRREIAVRAPHPREITPPVRNQTPHRLHLHGDHLEPVTLLDANRGRHPELGCDSVGDPLNLRVIGWNSYDRTVIADSNKEGAAPGVGEGRQILKGSVGPLLLELDLLAFL